MGKKEKCSKTQKNRIVIHKENEEKRIYKNLLAEYLTNGWTLGPTELHKQHNSEKHLGKEPWNKNTVGVMSANNTSFKKGNTPWNKGCVNQLSENEITNLTTLYLVKKLPLKECCKKLNISFWTANNYLKSNNLMRTNSESHKGHITTKETKERISAKNRGHSVSEKTKLAVSQANKKRTLEQLKIQVSKAWLTKKINGTCNASKPEKELYEKLLKENVNKTIYRQYKDDKRYPYYCDFYIKEDDLFIELNAHWTHGGHPFDVDNPDDIAKLNSWKEKAKTSKFYQQAIYVWTDLDKRKQQCAKENKLNYKVIY